MGKTSREKGSEFERLIAGLILARFKGMKKTDCYRTPLSGGHPHADAGDLCISDALWAQFPYVVECKHTKSWTPAHLLSPCTLQVMHWMSQARNARIRVDARNVRKGGQWLLVMRGNNSPIYCVTPLPLDGPARVVRQWIDRGAMVFGGPSFAAAGLQDYPSQLFMTLRFKDFLQSL